MTESTIDFPKKRLCPDIWEKGYDETGTNEVWKLTSQAKEKVLSVYQAICPEAKMLHIVGSITSNSYTENGDIDLHFLDVGREFKDSDELDEYRKQLQQKYVRKVFVGTHPIEVYYQDNEFQDYMSVGCYDVLKQKWIIGPELKDPSFNPYSEYYAEVLSQSEEKAKKIRNMIFSIYEIAVVLKKNIGTDMQDKLFMILKARLEDVKKLYDEIRNTRKVHSAPTSKEEALKYRSSREWKVADASFKLFDKYGYLEIMRKLIELNEVLETSEISEEAATAVLEIVKKYINNADKLSEQEMYESEQIEEGAKEMIASLALALAAFIPGQVSAKTIANAQKTIGLSQSEIIQRKKEFVDKVAVLDLNKKYGKFSTMSAINVTALTLYGEGRSEIANGGIYLIADTILNRTYNGVQDVPGVCLGRADKKAFQYSYWNNNKSQIPLLKKGLPCIPTTITNSIERTAWDTCIKLAIDVITEKYKAANTDINSYYVTKMKNPPSWANQLTNVVVKGAHTFGYLKSNDPKYTDMTTMTPRSQKKKQSTIQSTRTYKVKKGDTFASIAPRFNTTVDAIKVLNPTVNPRKLKIGQILKI